MSVHIVVPKPEVSLPGYTTKSIPKAPTGVYACLEETDTRVIVYAVGKIIEVTNANDEIAEYDASTWADDTRFIRTEETLNISFT